MNSFLLFLTGVFSGIFAGFFLTKSFWKTNRETELNVKLKSQEKLENENGDKTYISEEIVRLNKLRNDGVLTEKEFEKAKEKLLS